MVTLSVSVKASFDHRTCCISRVDVISALLLGYHVLLSVLLHHLLWLFQYLWVPSVNYTQSVFVLKLFISVLVKSKDCRLRLSMPPLLVSIMRSWFKAMLDARCVNLKGLWRNVEPSAGGDLAGGPKADLGLNIDVVRKVASLSNSKPTWANRLLVYWEYRILLLAMIAMI